MERITSFTIDHNRLKEGIYVSRIDQFGEETFTTFDIRMKRPNQGDFLTTTSSHTIEHIGATYLRNHKDFGLKVLYFGPMGCRTGFYLILHGRYESVDIADLLTDLFQFIVDYMDTIPGASAIECGNYKDLELTGAKEEALRYLTNTLKHLDPSNTVYPQA